MVKLASARDSRIYGLRFGRNRCEYINSGLYVFSVILLLGGFFAQLLKEPKSGLVLLLIALVIIAAVNVHDLFAHLAGIQWRLQLVEFDLQLVLVEFSAPVVQAVGSLLSFWGILFVFILAEKMSGYSKLEKHALNLLIAGPVLWLLGSIHNSCQIYERADGHVQMMQQSIHIPFLMASLLFTVGAIINMQEKSETTYHDTKILGNMFIWFGIFGGTLLLLGGLANLVKVFRMQQGELRLEKLRGGAHELLTQEREWLAPLVVEEQRRLRQRQVEEIAANTQPYMGAPSEATPYKDALVGETW